MEGSNTSLWGTWWTPLRRWVYPIWLAYEASYRFYEYSLSVHRYFSGHHYDISFYIGSIGATTLDVACSTLTFLVCTIFLTVPACFLLYNFFREDNLTKSIFEKRLKKIF